MIFAAIVMNCFALLRIRLDLAELLRRTSRVLPFVVLTFLFNVWLADWVTAVYVAMKLLLVCFATFGYYTSVGMTGVVRGLRKILSPLGWVGVDVEDAVLIIVLATSLLPILRRDISETKMALRAKGMSLTIATIDVILVRVFTRLFRRIDEIDAALRAKGVW